MSAAIATGLRFRPALAAPGRSGSFSCACWSAQKASLLLVERLQGSSALPLVCRFLSLSPESPVPFALYAARLPLGRPAVRLAADP